LCSFGKPIILSTGASSLEEIQEAVAWIDKCGNPLALLHCILNYPTEDQNANLGMIECLQEVFPEKLIGYSDHTEPKDMKCLEYATILGSKIIEKHFTHNKNLPGNDHYHAMDKEDLILFKTHLKNICNKKEARNSVFYGQKEKIALKTEAPARENARRSLVLTKSLPAGTMLKPEHLTFKRPAHGISPKYFDNILNRCLKANMLEDSILTFDDLI